MTGATIPSQVETKEIGWLDKRLLLLAATTALFGVWFLGALTREIYPAPIFPGFGTIPTDEEIQPVRVRVLAFESNEGRAILSADDAFVGAFDSFHARMLDSLVRAGGPDEDLAAWARDRAHAEFGWDCVHALEVVEVHSDDSVPGTMLNRFEFGDCRSE
ncbi:MAG: hypothetical protein ACR2QO_00105 [Acidimicrobiales bacterium]